MNPVLTQLLDENNDFKIERLSSLYSNFDRLKSINPDGYAANIATWHNVIKRVVKAGAIPGSNDRMILHTGRELMQAFDTPDFGIPTGLSCVVNDGIANGELVPLNTFINSKDRIYDQGWFSNPWRMIRISLQNLGSLGYSTEEVDMHRTGSYVLTKNVEDISDAVMKVMGQKLGRIDRVMPRNVFEQQVSDILGLHEILSDNDIVCLLTFLSRDRRQLVYDKEVVKIRSPDDFVSLITDNDRDIVAVQALQSKLARQVHELSNSIEGHTESARAALTAKHRYTALRHLRSRKIQEEMLKRRSEMLIQTEDACIKIEQAADQVQFIATMKQATSALRMLNTQAGGISNADSIVEDLSEEMLKAEDIGSALGQAADGYTIDESEVNRELEAMENQDRGLRHVGAQNIKKALDSIPSPPQTVGAARTSLLMGGENDAGALKAADMFERMSLESDDNGGGLQHTSQKHQYTNRADRSPIRS